jgi:CheY-like chemotaxis protein
MIPTSLILIDDDELCIMLSKIAVKSTGMVDEFQIFNNGEDALAHLKKSAAGAACPDLILLDLNMPIMDGWDFLDLV